METHNAKLNFPSSLKLIIPNFPTVSLPLSPQPGEGEQSSIGHRLLEEGNQRHEGPKCHRNLIGEEAANFPRHAVGQDDPENRRHPSARRGQSGNVRFFNTPV